MSQQSDAHSVSSGLSHTSSSVPQLQKATSSSVASSQLRPQSQSQPPNPLVQNPFESLSGVPTNSNSNNTVPPSHVAVRMPQSPAMMMTGTGRMPPQPSTPLKTGTGMPPATTAAAAMHLSTPPPPSNAAAAPTTTTTTMNTTGVAPIMGSSQMSLPVVPPQSYSGTIHSPMSQPTNTGTSFPPNNFSVYDHPAAPMTHPDDAAGAGARSTTYYSNNNQDYHHFMFDDDDENTVPSSLGNTTTTDDQLSLNQPPPDYPNYHRHPNNYPPSHSHNNNNTNHNNSTTNYSEFDPSSFPTTIGSSSFTARIMESTKRLLTSGSTPDLNPDSARRTTTPVLTATSMPPNDDPTHNNNRNRTTACLIAGYLQKLGRNQKWQTRWFETNGIDLSYYKSSKRSNLLATLDLQKVGVIEIDIDDKTEHSFRIQVLGRLYKLRANSRASCQDWVITLNRVKEARMQQGNVKLVGLPLPTMTTKALDLLNPHSASISSKQQQQQQLLHNDSENFIDGTPRVVVVSNRERTHGVDEEEQWDQLIRIDDNNGLSGTGTFNNDSDIDPAAAPVEAIYNGGAMGTLNSNNNNASTTTSGGSISSSGKRLSSIGTVVAARWTKHSSKLQRFRNKLTKWARSVKQYSCTDNDAVILTSGGRPPHHGDVVHLDKYLHPPGHDDKRYNNNKQQQQFVASSKMSSVPTTLSNTSRTMPLNSLTTSTATSAVLPSTTTTTTSNNSTMMMMTTTTNKPLAITDRNISTASDYDVRMLS